MNDVELWRRMEAQTAQLKRIADALEVITPVRLPDITEVDDKLLSIKPYVPGGKP